MTYVLGSNVPGPNVFLRSTAESTHADIGPHHRWSSGALFDRIDTDGELNIRNRGNMGHWPRLGPARTPSPGTRPPAA